jgi:hypothetical protein
MKLTALLSAAAVSAGLCLAASTASAQITGTVKLDGQAPEPQQINMAANPQCAAAHPNPVLEESIVAGDNGELANVVVNVKAPEGKQLKGELPKDPIVLDQKGCQYVPHVVAMMVGQDFIIKNDDNFLHNVHSLALDNTPFNFGQPQQEQKGVSRKKDITTAERFQVKCDVHPWMMAHVNVFDHPFFAVTNEKGQFSIPTKGLEDGTYTIEIWQEKLAPEPLTKEITVKDGKATVEEIKISAKAAARGNAVEGEAKLASAKTAGETKSCCTVKGRAQAIASAAATK